jgi:hypothetical protein
MPDPEYPVEVEVKALQKLYDERKDDCSPLKIKGLHFIPGYLKYILQWLDDKPNLIEKQRTVLFTKPIEKETK